MSSLKKTTFIMKMRQPEEGERDISHVVLEEYSSGYDSYTVGPKDEVLFGENQHSPQHLTHEEVLEWASLTLGLYPSVISAEQFLGDWYVTVCI